MVPVTVLVTALLMLASAGWASNNNATVNKCPNVAFVMHTYYKAVNLTTFSSNTFLAGLNLVIITGHDVFTSEVGSQVARRGLISVSYNGNPGKNGVTFLTQGAGYRGTHRTMAGLLIANDTFPDADWFYVFDDDNYVFVDAICEALGTLDAAVPLLLAGHVGPMHGQPPCRNRSDATHWSCCLDPSVPCVANTGGRGTEPSYFAYSVGDTFAPTPCADHPSNCCNTVPWAEGMQFGYPYRHAADVTASYLRGHAGGLSPHSIHMWPYGGSTYAMSRGMMAAVGRDQWERYVYGLQCYNADINVMVAVLNAGYSLTEFRELERRSRHHVKRLDTFAEVALGFVGNKDGSGPVESDSVRAAVCAWMQRVGQQVSRPVRDHCALYGIQLQQRRVRR